MSQVTDYILNLPESAEFDTMPEPLQQVITGLAAEWPSFPMLYTKPVAGRKLIHVRLNQQLTEAQLEGMFAQFGLDWEVGFIRSAYKVEESGDYLTIKPLDKAALLPFMNDITDGETTRAPTLADTLYLAMYAGTDPVEI